MLIVPDANPYIKALNPYLPGKPVDQLKRELGLDKVIKLASNENPLGASPKALKALSENINKIARYPEGDCHLLREKLAKKLSIQASQLTFGNGSNDVLDAIARAFLSIDSNAVFSQYGFAVYPIATQSVGAKSKMVDAYPQNHITMPLGHDLDAMLQAIDSKTKVIFIANPNNPTGTWVQKSALHSFLKAVPKSVVVVLDEAYIEYVPDEEKQNFVNGLDWVEKFENLIVTRTFSKIYGLAGLRVGYAVSSSNIADYLNRVRQPFNVNLLAQVAAESALDDNEFLAKSSLLNAQGKQYLITALNTLGCVCLPSMGNFLCVRFVQDCAKLNEALLKEGVIVRPVNNYNMTDYLRITIGTKEQNKAFITSLKKVINEL